jgi:hypothetical protein
MLDLAIPLVGKPGNSAKFGFDCPVKGTREGRQPRRRSCAHGVAASESAGDETRSSKGPRYRRPRRAPERSPRRRTPAARPASPPLGELVDQPHHRRGGVAHHGSAGRGHYDVAAGPHKATDQPQILQLTGPRLEAEIGIVP